MKILLLGSGGGYDVFSGYFKYLELVAQGHDVSLANLSFTDDLTDLPNAKHIGPFVIEVTPSTMTTRKNEDYFPELYLAKHLQTPVYALRNLPPEYIYAGLRDLVRHLQIERVICVDAGWDAMLLGHEGTYACLASPCEDLATMFAASELLKTGQIKEAYLMCVSVPTETNPPIWLFSKNLDQLAKNGGLVEVQPIRSGHDDFERLLNSLPEDCRSIPNECILAALKGVNEPGHFINPRLAARISEEHAFPPVTPVTLMQFILHIDVFASQSKVLQALRKTFPDELEHDPIDDPETITQSDMRFHCFVNVWYNDDDHQPDMAAKVDAKKILLALEKTAS